MILLFDRLFQVGDRVNFDGIYREIVSIGLRIVRLVTLHDSLVTIPNSRFITDFVSSNNSGALDMMVTTKFHLSIDADINSAKETLFEVVATSRYVFLKKPIDIVVSEDYIGDRPVVVLVAKAYVLDVHFEKAFETDIFIRATEEFKRIGIKRPKMRFEVVQNLD